MRFTSKLKSFACATTQRTAERVHVKLAFPSVRADVSDVRRRAHSLPERDERLRVGDRLRGRRRGEADGENEREHVCFHVRPQAGEGLRDVRRLLYGNCGGAMRFFVACSNAYASSISRGSPHAPPRELTPIR